MIQYYFLEQCDGYHSASDASLESKTLETRARSDSVLFMVPSRAYRVVLRPRTQFFSFSATIGSTTTIAPHFSHFIDILILPDRK